MNANVMKSERLFCLDALRGLDMLFLTVLQGLILAVAGLFGGPSSSLRYWLGHPSWGGFTAYDQIMPCFIFMCGAAVPLALKRFVRDGRPTAAFWKHIAGRFALLWIAGMFIQGRLTTFDVMQISPYSNTLQAIAAGYVIAAFVFLVKVRWIRFAAPFALAGVYTLLLQTVGDPTSPTGNCAQLVEQWFVGLFGFPEGAQAYKTGNYTWLLTSLMFGAMAVWGSNCTEIVTSRLSQGRKAALLFAGAALLTTVGWVAQIWIAPVKQIFALSFTARSMGVCVALLGALYVLTDIWKLRRGWWLVTLFGQFSFTCYIVHHGFGSALDAVAERLVGGGVKAALSPELYRVVFLLTVAAVLTASLVVRRRLKEWKSLSNAAKKDQMP